MLKRLARAIGPNVWGWGAVVQLVIALSFTLWLGPSGCLAGLQAAFFSVLLWQQERQLSAAYRHLNELVAICMAFTKERVETRMRQLAQDVEPKTKEKARFDA